MIVHTHTLSCTQWLLHTHTVKGAALTPLVALAKDSHSASTTLILDIHNADHMLSTL